MRLFCSFSAPKGTKDLPLAYIKMFHGFFGHYFLEKHLKQRDSKKKLHD